MEQIDNVTNDWADGFICGLKAGMRKSLRIVKSDLDKFNADDFSLSAFMLVLQDTIKELDSEQ